MSDLEHRLGQLAEEGVARGGTAVFDAAATDAEVYRARRRRRKGGVVAIALVIGLAAGGLVVARNGNSDSASSNGASVLSVVAATESTDTARFQTVAQTEQEAPRHRTSATTDGIFDFGRHIGSETRATSDGSRPGLEMRWFGSHFYQRLGTATERFEYGAPDGKTWILMDSARLDTPGGCPIPGTGPLSAVLGVSSPSSTPTASVDVLASLRTAGATLTKIGVGSVRDTPTTHWRVDTHGVTTTTAPARCTAGLSGFYGVKTSRPQVELWTDSQDRLRRIVITTKTTFKTSGGATLGPSGFVTTPLRDTTVTQTTTTELFDFGVDVHVEEPAPDQVYDVTAPLGALLAGAGTVTPAEWRDIAHGSLRGEGWTLWFARTSTRWRCYQVQGISQSDPPPFPLGNPLPKHDGHPSECFPSPSGIFENGPFTTIVSGLDADPSFLVGRVSDSANDARLIFSDGTSIPFTIDPDTRIVQWTGPQSPTPVKIEAGGRTCSLDDLSDDACQSAEFGEFG